MRHSRNNGPEIDAILTGIVAGLAVGIVITIAVFLFGHHSKHPLNTVVKTVDPTTTVAPTTTSTTVQLGPPQTIVVNGRSGPNPIMMQIPGAVYTAPKYTGAPVEGTVSAESATGAHDPDGRTAAQYAQTMGLPPNSTLLVVGSVIIGYVPPTH